MDNLVIMGIGLGLVMIIMFGWLWWRQRQQLKALEEHMYEALGQLWQQQGSLAQESRVNQELQTQRLSEQLDRRVEGLSQSTDRHLERIYKNLGQVQSLAGGVDQLQRVLNNVKTRGIWGEMQLGNLLYDMLPKSRVAENAEVRPRSGLRVEYAIILPGAGERPLLLPIDAKFPVEDYQRLQQARELGDLQEAEANLKLLERRFKKEAKDIADKYICPPYSTDFAIMYLPSEGLFAEALSMPGLAEELQVKLRVSLAGPSTLGALINSLQMGFRTLAIREKTDEVWQLLTQVKGEMAALAQAVEKTEKKLEEAQQGMEQAGKRVARLSARLGKVEELSHETRD